MNKTGIGLHALREMPDEVNIPATYHAYLVGFWAACQLWAIWRSGEQRLGIQEHLLSDIKADLQVVHETLTKGETLTL